MSLTWQFLAITVPLLFVIYQSFSKLLPKDLSVFLVSAYASLMGFFVMLLMHLLLSNNKSIVLSLKYLPLVLGIGALIAIGNAGIIKAYWLGAPQSAFTSLYYPLLIVYGVLFGILFFGEKLNWYQVVGLLLIFIGLVAINHFKS